MRRFFLLLAILLLPANAFSNRQTLEESLRTIPEKYGSKKEPVVSGVEFAKALMQIKGVSREWAALLSAVGIHESALSERIRLGLYHDCNGPADRCEGDAYRDKDGVLRHKAWGLWQLHQNLTNDQEWGSTELQIQARAASRMLRGAYYRCKNSGVPHPLGTIRAFAGRSCTMPFPGESKRVVTYNRILSQL